MIDLNEAKQQIRDNIQWDSKRPSTMGGQQCGMPSYPVILKSEELDLEITIGYHKGQYKNKLLALTLFELTLDELIK